MPSIVRHFWPCIEVVCAGVNCRTKMTYGELADNLRLKLARQEWEGLLDLVAGKMKREIGCDLTWNIVYATGAAKGLGRYFSNGDKEPGSTLLDPKDKKQVAEYECTLQEIYGYAYKLENIDGTDRLTKTRRT
jgi:hypothetical protein